MAGEDWQCDDVSGFNRLYGPHWWSVIGEALMRVILPIEYYQMLSRDRYEWDNLGRRAYQEDLARYPDLDSDDARRRQSLFDFHYAEGIVFGLRRQEQSGTRLIASKT